MKQVLFILLLLPLAAMAQNDNSKKQSDFTGWKMNDCLVYGLKELAKGENGVLKGAAAGRITPNTKVIYIANQSWLKDVPDTVNGIVYKYVDIDSNIKTIAAQVEMKEAAVFYVSPFELKTNMSELWIFPIDIKKQKRKYVQEYPATGYKMSFFFNYDPPTYEFRGTDAVVLE